MRYCCNVPGFRSSARDAIHSAISETESPFALSIGYAEPMGAWDFGFTVIHQDAPDVDDPPLCRPEHRHSRDGSEGWLPSDVSPPKAPQHASRADPTTSPGAESGLSGDECSSSRQCWPTGAGLHAGNGGNIAAVCNCGY